MRETILTSNRSESIARHGCSAPRHHGLHAIINYIRLSAKFSEIGPIEQTMNSYRPGERPNHKKGEPSFKYDRSKSIVRKVKEAKVLIGPN